ncbi:TonB-dependent receptor [Telluria beijingensis]|uniref:TonB-dependent receptor n=1 Tax=Telluria beijingensis TaxID=3068633 RepID=UPI0027963B8F|nr:TonB-dependent receptor [Massilia sp. REN29]
MKKLQRKLLAGQMAAAVGAMVGMGTGLAHAQAPVETAAAPAAPKAALQSVVVTAQRRAENPQEVPISVTAITAETLGDRNITDLSQMEGMSPGFTFGRSGADARPAMRGVRTDNVAINGDTTIGFFVDGIYKSRAQQALANFVDIDRVEIQRGPQGTLYGRNTFGGNISLVTNAPELNKTHASVSVLVGNFDRLRVEGMYNVPLGETMAARLVIADERADGYVKNDFNPGADLFDQDLTYGRISLLFKPNKDFEATLRADWTKQDANGAAAFGYKQAGTYYDPASCQQLFNATLGYFNPRPGNRDGVSDCVRTAGAGNGTGANAVGSGADLGVPIHKPGDAWHYDADYQSFMKLRDKSASLDMTWRFDKVALKSITGYADFEVERTADSDMSASTIAIDFQRTTAETFSQELQIQSVGDGPFEYVAGYYYFNDKLRGTFINQQLPRTIRSGALANPLSLPQASAGTFDDPYATTESNAFYAQGSWKATEQLKLTLGARRTVDKKDFRFANANSVLPLGANGQPDGNLITIDTASPPRSAFGSAGVSNCVPARGPGFYCDPNNPSVLWGATYDEEEFSKTTMRAAADYKLSKANLLYASYSTGFRSGGFNSGQTNEAVRTFLPEEVKAIELGSKNRFLDNTLQVNLAAFFNRYDNLQEQRQTPVGGTTISSVFNATEAESKGLEVEWQWKASPALSFGGGISFLDAKYTSWKDVALPYGTSILVADASATSPTVMDGVTVAPIGQRRVFAPGYDCGVLPGTGGAGQPPVAFGCDLSGKRVPYSPRIQGSVFGSYEFSLPNGGYLTPMAVVTFSDGYYGQPYNAKLERQPGYAKTDFKLNWEINDRWSALLYVDNAFDKQTINRFVWGGGGGLQVSAAAPRTFGLRVNFQSF